MVLYKHDFGSAVAIGIEDPDPIQIERKYFSFYNHQATSGELHWLGPNFAYLWTKNEDLNKAVLNMALSELLNLDCGKSKGIKLGLMPQAQIRAREIMDSIDSLSFIVKDGEAEDYQYSMGYLEFETPDLSRLPIIQKDV